MNSNEHLRYLKTLLEAYQNSGGHLKESKRNLFVSYIEINPALIGLIAKNEKSFSTALTLEELRGKHFEEQAKKNTGLLKGLNQICS